MIYERTLFAYSLLIDHLFSYRPAQLKSFKPDRTLQIDQTYHSETA